MKASTRAAERTLQLATLSSPLGWIAAAGRDGVLHRVTMGHATEHQAIRFLERQSEAAIELDDWYPELIDLLDRYAAGHPVDFSRIRVDLAHLTPFQRSVVQHCRRIPAGGTLTYGQLAAKAGSPGAARAVGNVMANNRCPLVVPCHRVVGAAGSLGGFSAPQGIALKRRLLELESAGLLLEV